MNEPKSPEMLEALKVLNELELTGDVEQQLAALNVAHQQILAIADRAGEDATAIRGMVRGLESKERVLLEWPEWNNPPADRG